MTRSKAALVLMLGVAVIAQVAVSAQKAAAAPKPMALTALDYIEIKQLVSRYAFAVDTGSNNGYDYADLFAADGEFMRPYARGREQLAALARGARLGPANTVHYIMNHVIEPTPEAPSDGSTSSSSISTSRAIRPPRRRAAARARSTSGRRSAARTANWRGRAATTKTCT